MVYGFGQPLFADRRHAGERLAGELSALRLENAVVVGLARGGIEVAAEVARRLDLPLDTLAVRKVGHPRQPEYAIGAVTPDGDAFIRARDGLSDAEVDDATAQARARAVELDRVLHAEQPAADPAGATILLVDDGLATGATMTAAVRWAKAAGAARVVAAVPVGAEETAATLELEADEVVCPERLPLFGAVGFWYEEFAQVTSERALRLLASCRAPGALPSSERLRIRT